MLNDIKPKCVMLIGIPASCKSTLANKDRYKTYKRISFDDKRFKVLDSKNTGIYYLPDIEPEIQAYILAKLKLHVVQKHDIIIDATNLTRESRDKKLKLLTRDYHVNFFIMPMDLQWALENNKKRERFVDETVIKSMFYSYEPVSNIDSRYGFSHNIFYLDKSDI